MMMSSILDLPSRPKPSVLDLTPYKADPWPEFLWRVEHPPTRVIKAGNQPKGGVLWQVPERTLQDAYLARSPPFGSDPVPTTTFDDEDHLKRAIREHFSWRTPPKDPCFYTAFSSLAAAYGYAKNWAQALGDSRRVHITRHDLKTIQGNKPARGHSSDKSKFTILSVGKLRERLGLDESYSDDEYLFLDQIAYTTGLKPEMTTLTQSLWDMNDEQRRKETDEKSPTWNARRRNLAVTRGHLVHIPCAESTVDMAVTEAVEMLCRAASEAPTVEGALDVAGKVLDLVRWEHQEGEIKKQKLPQ